MPVIRASGPSPSKAGKMLREGKVHGKPLTPKQRKMFRAIEHGWKPTGKKGG